MSQGAQCRYALKSWLELKPTQAAEVQDTPLSKCPSRASGTKMGMGWGFLRCSILEGALANHLKLKWYGKCSWVLCNCVPSVQQLEPQQVPTKVCHSGAALVEQWGQVWANAPGLNEVIVQSRCLDPTPIPSAQSSCRGNGNCLVTSLSNLERVLAALPLFVRALSLVPLYSSCFLKRGLSHSFVSVP